LHDELLLSEAAESLKPAALSVPPAAWHEEGIVIKSTLTPGFDYSSDLTCYERDNRYSIGNDQGIEWPRNRTTYQEIYVPIDKLTYPGSKRFGWQGFLLAIDYLTVPDVNKIDMPCHVEDWCYPIVPDRKRCLHA